MLEGKEASSNSDAPIAQQQRSSREAPNDIEDIFGWTLLHNGSGKFLTPSFKKYSYKYLNFLETHWIIRELRPNTKYSFRVKSRNAYGDSNWSSASEIFDSSEYARRHEEARLKDLFSFALPLLAALCICVAALITIFKCGNIRRNF